jgi:hypothetical protein
MGWCKAETNWLRRRASAPAHTLGNERRSLSSGAAR